MRLQLVPHSKVLLFLGNERMTLARKTQGTEETFKFEDYSILIFSPIDENHLLVITRACIFVKLPPIT